MSDLRTLHCFALAVLTLAAGPVRAADHVPAVLVDDFSYLDTSGEPADQTAAHQRRLEAFIAALRRDVADDARLRLVSPACGASCPAADAPPAARLHMAAGAGAGVVITGGVQKLSTLVQWARASAIDVASNRVLFDKIFTFRGDSDEAWERAEIFVSRQVRDALAPEPIQLVLLPFELDDTSAGAALGETESDQKGLQEATEAVRQLLAQSGRYRLQDAAGEIKPGQPLLACDDCEARAARAVGAQQSLLGIIRRIGRTEYIVGFRVRQADTGALVAAGDSGLRLGANYSWSRGAVRLVRERLLETGGSER
ncbi:hypothetical protein SSBR45G_43320 [Bradyrhizobium sp. SSBR45G]|uniref:DUF2380 domain-containing protein n=1 Tax=unclassified Bradyrhizobium TaxID=2631580 RepID=UPI0023429290|nr:MULTISPECIES: DUF2380 domain-containing protein [unclassified Bradyrhizobium]GLH79423.1 hypothetical protein SSBR45G_43320 [Bradyrhizobium sp. SSBR45G]GLH86800.1 hypothetical protein SSBR45R_42600 [Bradyrhizobium sp. SSBR45R]